MIASCDLEISDAIRAYDLYYIFTLPKRTILSPKVANLQTKNNISHAWYESDARGDEKNSLYNKKL